MLEIIKPKYFNNEQGQIIIILLFYYFMTYVIS